MCGVNTIQRFGFLLSGISSEQLNRRDDCRSGWVFVVANRIVAGNVTAGDGVVSAIVIDATCM